ncbi:reverse transcriptase family protein [Paraburkholderia sediminicola]|uniref:reverse transcriptase family protein n=1 Tax=Paraburkholderia sediminicola TaxID=458836 RepID=UPI0038BC9D91
MRIALECEGRGQKGACRTAAAPSNRPPFGRRHNESQHSFALPVNTPPLLVTFPSLDNALSALSERTRHAYEAEFRALVELRFPPAISNRLVATLFGYSPSFVGAMVRRPARYYRTFEIRSGAKVRAIQAPRVALKVIQQWIGGNLANAIPYRDTTFGFVPGRSHIDAAGAHCGAKWAYSIDIKDFFQTTSAEAVRQALMTIGYSEHAAQLVSSLSCFNGYLAQGAPSSPALSNLVFFHYDIQLEEFATTHQLTYTRYADDIVFSGHGEPPENLRELVKRTIESGGWTIAPKKEKMQRKPYRLKVHGLLVDGETPRLTKGYRRRIRALRHLSEHGKVAPEQQAKVAGHLNYADQVYAWAKKDPNDSDGE